MFSDRKILWWRVEKNMAFLMSAWNTYFISENCGANIDFLFLKQWFYGILFWNMKEVALWVTNLTLMVNGTMDWVSLCEDIWSQQRKLWAPDESVLYWWISRLIGHEVVSKRDGVNQRVDHQDVLCVSSGQQDGVISALPLLTHGTLRTQGAPKVLMIYSNTNIKMSWQRIWICTCCYS